MTQLALARPQTILRRNVDLVGPTGNIVFRMGKHEEGESVGGNLRPSTVKPLSKEIAPLL